jgi:hypothetical protein
MAKRGVNFDAFDRELTDSKPELAARIGVQSTDEPASDQKVIIATASPALRIVPVSAPEVKPLSMATEPPPQAETPRRNGKLRGRVQRADGSEAGRQIVYLPIELDERLRRYAFESGRALTDVSSELLSDAILQNLPPIR